MLWHFQHSHNSNLATITPQVTPIYRERPQIPPQATLLCSARYQPPAAPPFYNTRPQFPHKQPHFTVQDPAKFSTALTTTKFPRHFHFCFQVCLLILNIVLFTRFSTRTSLIDNSKQSNFTFICVVGYWPLSGFTRSSQYKVSNLICWICQKDWSINKFILTLHHNHLDNNATAPKKHWCKHIYFILYTIYHVECFLCFD